MTPFPTGGDLTEWKKCRATIGRLDGTIADLRKYGFSLVTVLITASSFLGGRVQSIEGMMDLLHCLSPHYCVLASFGRLSLGSRSGGYAFHKTARLVLELFDFHFTLLFLYGGEGHNGIFQQ